MEKIPEENSLDSMEGLETSSVEIPTEKTSASDELTRKETPNPERLQETRDALSENETGQTENLSELTRHLMGNIARFHQLFNCDRKDLSGDIREAEALIGNIDIVVDKLKESKQDDMRDELIGLKSAMNLFVQAMKESRIGKKAWLSDYMKNRDEVHQLNQRLTDETKKYRF